MSGDTIGICELCGEQRHVEGTSHTGALCIDCHKLVIQECQAAIAAIKKRKAVRG
jgi:hypothetical protein